MEKFFISSDDCLILKAFKLSTSLREAALLLNCDPAGLARRVKTISSQYGFLQKVDNRWQLTALGVDLVAWTEASIQSQNKILLAKSSLRIASTTWFSAEILIPSLPILRKILGAEVAFSLSAPQKNFELSLIDGSVDFVVVCHPPESPEIEHKQVVEEQWILIAPRSWKKDLSPNSAHAFDVLRGRPFIRHSQMNTDLFFPNLDLHQDSGIRIDNLIGIRSAVCEGLGWSLVPKFLVARQVKDDKVMEVPVQIPIHDRKVCVWWLRNRPEHKRQANKIVQWLKEVC